MSELFLVILSRDVLKFWLKMGCVLHRLFRVGSPIWRFSGCFLVYVIVNVAALCVEFYMFTGLDYLIFFFFFVNIIYSKFIISCNY